jgi:serine/threonine-protein phosphatase 2A regulatory subunit A
VKKEMRRLFGELCMDDTPMVRRAAAKALGVSAVVLSPTVATNAMAD